MTLPYEGGPDDRAATEETPAEEALRALACWLGVGGYNAPTVDAKVFEAKIRDGVLVFGQAHGLAARDLAEQVLAMDLITPRGIRARELARQVLGITQVAAPSTEQKLEEVHGELMGLAHEYGGASIDWAQADPGADLEARYAEMKAARAALSTRLRSVLSGVGAADTRTCTCHPDDNPPKPCPRKFALSECRAAALEASHSTRATENTDAPSGATGEGVDPSVKVGEVPRG